MIFMPYYYSRDWIVKALAEVQPKPAAMEQILRSNQGRLA
jgi:hypothetical protein